MSIRFSDKGIHIEEKYYRFYRDIPTTLMNQLNGQQKEWIRLYFNL